MWRGVLPAVTTKFKDDGSLDHEEMIRCFGIQIDAGVDGLIACGSLGEGPMLSHEERIDVLKLCKQVSGSKPSLLTVAEAATRDACALAKKAAQAGADGLMVVPSTIYHTDPRETVATLKAIAQAGDLPIMIYSNRLAYRVDVTVEIMEELAGDTRFVAVKESSDDIRRSTDIINRFGDPERAALRVLGQASFPGQEGVPARQGQHAQVQLVVRLVEGDQVAHPGRGHAGARMMLVDEQDLAALGLQFQGAGGADDAGADDDDVGAVHTREGNVGRLAMADLIVCSAFRRRSPASGRRGARTRSLEPMATASASLMFCTR